MNIAPPIRASRSYTQHLLADPARVFPLLCPVREADWIEGWDPALVISDSGVAERDCVFLTGAESSEAIWYISRHDPEQGFVEMLKITPTVTACRLSIQLSATGNDRAQALVTYTHTSLGPEGDRFVAAFTEDYYTKFMQDWEARINHYLLHGCALSALGG